MIDGFPDKWWVTYRAHSGANDIPMRTGFIDTVEAAFQVAMDLAEFDHVHTVVVEAIKPLAKVK